MLNPNQQGKAAKSKLFNRDLEGVQKLLANTLVTLRTWQKLIKTSDEDMKFLRDLKSLVDDAIKQ
jgi:hypothetical protein